MKFITDITARFLPKWDVKSQKYTIVDPQFNWELMLAHLTEMVIPDLLSSRPAHEYDGELYHLMFADLYNIAFSVVNTNEVNTIKVPYTANLVADTFRRNAATYSTLYEYISKVYSKDQALQLSSYIVQQSDIVQALIKASNDTAAANNPLLKIDPAAKKNTFDLLNKLTGYDKEKGKAANPIEVIKYMKTVTPMAPESNAADALEEKYNRIATYAGNGRKTVLKAEAYKRRYAEYDIILQAIRSLSHNRYKFTEHETPIVCQTDAYMLAISFIAYLHHSSSEEIYDQNFPTYKLIGTPQAKNSMLASSAKKMAWFWAGLTECASVAELRLTMKYVDNIIGFINTADIKDYSTIKDFFHDLDRSRDLLSKAAIAVSVAHTDTIYNYYSKMSGDAVMLPRMMRDFLDTTTFDKFINEKIIKDVPWNALTMNTVHRSLFPRSMAPAIIIFLQDIVRMIKLSAEVLYDSMSSFITDSTDFEPNSLNIPTTLFAINDKVDFSDFPFQYLSLYDKSILRVGLPKYDKATLPSNPDKVAGLPPRRWIYSPYLYGVINLAGAYAAHYDTSVRMIFPRQTHPAAIGDSVAKYYSSWPLPSCYSEDLEVPAYDYNLRDLVNHNSAKLEELIPGQDVYTTLAQIIAYATTGQAAELMSVLSAYMRVTVTTDGKTNLLEPHFPYSWGMPWQWLFAAQPAFDDPYYTSPLIHEYVPRVVSVPLTRQIETTPTLIETVVVSFYQHKMFPAPAPLHRMSILYAPGFPMATPIFKECFSQTTGKPLWTRLSLNLQRDKAPKSLKFIENKGLLDHSYVLPHLYFDVDDPGRFPAIAPVDIIYTMMSSLQVASVPPLNLLGMQQTWSNMYVFMEIEDELNALKMKASSGSSGSISNPTGPKGSDTTSMSESGPDITTPESVVHTTTGDVKNEALSQTTFVPAADAENLGDGYVNKVDVPRASIPSHVDEKDPNAPSIIKSKVASQVSADDAARETEAEKKKRKARGTSEGNTVIGDTSEASNE